MKENPLQQTKYYPLNGGENLSQPAIAIEPGELLSSSNYECVTTGGYRRIDGFERFDGQPSPSSLIETVDIEAARALIQPVPGEGDVRGVAIYKGVTYVFRNNVGSTECLMYESTVAGWSLVTTPTLSPSGKYRFVNYNFTGASSSVKLYGCDGVNKAFQFDGTTFTQIDTGMTTDTPEFINAHKRHLFLGFKGGSLQHSPIGDPTAVWTVVLGAGELGTGDEITNLSKMPGDTLGIFNRNSTYILYGTSAADWNLVQQSDESGAIADSVQRLGSLLYVDDRGITSLETVQAYGDFASSTISQKINKKLIPFIKNITNSIRIKNKDQYRLFFNNGGGVCLTLSAGKLIGMTSLQYGRPVLATVNGEDLTGGEISFFSSNDGYVYQMDKGTSFDGGSLTSTARLAFNHIGSPAYNKRFFKVTFEIDSTAETTIKFNSDYSYGASTVPTSREQDFTLLGGGGYWDTAEWEAVIWDGQAVNTAEAYIEGIGKNIGLYIYSEQTYQKPHTLQGAIIHYSGRGLAK
jgi:hypothetical protein